MLCIHAADILSCNGEAASVQADIVAAEDEKKAHILAGTLSQQLKEHLDDKISRLETEKERLQSAGD